jgi:hypothetical protein
MNPHSDRMTTDDWSDVPIGLKPDGSLILSISELPTLPTASRVVVGPAFFEIDGWIIAYSDIKKGTLNWFRERLLEWRNAEPCEANRVWLMGITDALHEAMLANL